MTLILGDCLEEMKKLKEGSVDLLFCDLPYNQTSCHWDCTIDLVLFWKEVNRICKETTPMFFTCSTKFGVSLINSNPKNFRYDMVWVKSAPCGFLNAKKMPMKKHEMLYVFYRKLPMYDLSSHKHKFLKTELRNTTVMDTDVYGTMNRPDYMARQSEPMYVPPLPTSVIIPETTTISEHVLRECNNKECYNGNINFNYEDREGAIYDPPLPSTILEIKSEKGKHATQKPTALIEWCLKYYSKEGDTVLDPTMGSGSTGVACKKMNRQFIGIEKDKDIYDIAVKRV